MSKPKIILVCGGRTFGLVPPWTPVADIAAEQARAKAEVALLRRTLDELTIDEGEMLPRDGTVVVHGMARGADTWADTWAVASFVPVRQHKADWKKNGDSAGPIRNQKMLDIEKPDLVVAFKGGAGTRDMVARAKAQGFGVLEVME